MLPAAQGRLQTGNSGRLGAHALCDICLAQASLCTSAKHLPKKLKLRPQRLIFSLNPDAAQCRLFEITVLHDFFTSTRSALANFNSLGGAFSDFLMNPWSMTIRCPTRVQQPRLWRRTGKQWFAACSANGRRSTARRTECR
jgi:hypothetical protein